MDNIIVKRGVLLTDPMFTDSATILCFSTECISLRAFGIAADLPKHYGYGSVHEHRLPMPVQCSRCRPADRATPGTIKVMPPPPSAEGPIIAALFAQYGIGDAVERNHIAQSQITRSQERAFVHALKKDTQENRYLYFEACISELKEFIVKYQKGPIRNVVFPSGIGCRGVEDQFWKTTYLPLIKQLALDLRPHKTKITILSLVDASDQPRESRCEEKEDTPVKKGKTKKIQKACNEDDDDDEEHERRRWIKERIKKNLFLAYADTEDGAKAEEEEEEEDEDPPKRRKELMLKAILEKGGAKATEGGAKSDALTNKKKRKTADYEGSSSGSSTITIDLEPHEALDLSPEGGNPKPKKRRSFNPFDSDDDLQVQYSQSFL